MIPWLEELIERMAARKKPAAKPLAPLPATAPPTVRQARGERRKPGLELNTATGEWIEVMIDGSTRPFKP